MRKLFNDEAGFIISAELVLVLTIGVLAMVVGLASLRDAITEELVDLSNAFGAISQSYNYRTVTRAATFATAAQGVNHGTANGSGFNDSLDDCDCANVTFVAVTGKTDSSSGTAE